MQQERKKLGTGAYVVAGMSFIPLIGVLFGIISIIRGLVTDRIGGKKIAIIGTLGILFTVIIYGTLFYKVFVKKDGIYDDMRKKMARTNLTSLVSSIEYYKVENGKYPDNLEILKKSLPQNSLVFITDPTKMKMETTDEILFYYQNSGDTYYLLGTGQDNVPFTEDDIFPQQSPKGDVGFRIKP